MSERYRELQRSFDQLADDLGKRMSLWLAVGNAAGFAAAANKLLDPEAIENAHLLLPATWAFAAGLVAACIFNGCLMGHQRAMSKYYGSDDTTEDKRHWALADQLLNWITASLLAAAGLFLFGLFYPLTALSLRFVAG